MKVHSRESYNELISRLISGKSLGSASRESLIETLEILSDPKAMQSISKSLRNIEAGNYGISLEEVEKELGIKDV